MLLHRFVSSSPVLFGLLIIINQKKEEKMMIIMIIIEIHYGVSLID